ncbi:hypothetical protein [Azospirillum canadense]|uniref:hypothetical protein n=1 Tax=Azospirillum canadense TaxID=403962 RepID=UPI002226B701|nr:hypothetical protein [Azospirillum canadense]MCW2242072.1 hypothetical protein [Azospirillum canadense]
MTDLLHKVLAAHGGLDRWNSFKTVNATMVSGGELWGMKGIEADSTRRRVVAAIHREWASVAPYGKPDWRMTFTPERCMIEAGDGRIVAERDHPRAAFANHALDTPWDPLHRSYFSGYAMWTYLNTPFLMALPKVGVEEIAPWREGDETWRVLRVTFPAKIESHCPVQDFYFGPDFLLRRHDYQVDISGGFPAAQYVHDRVQADGFTFPTKRRAHPRCADGRPDRDRTYVWIDLDDVSVG